MEILTDLQKKREARDRAIYERLKRLRSIEGASKTIAKRVVAAEFKISANRAYEIFRLMDARAQRRGSKK